MTLLIQGLIWYGCDEDSNIELQKELQNDQIELYGEINQVYVTRVNDAGFADGDAIGVFVVDYENGESSPLNVTGNHADNVRFTYNEETGKWAGDIQLYWTDKVTPVDVYSYYPYDANLAEVKRYSHTILSDQQKEVNGISGYEISDFLWAKAEKMSSSDGVISLMHNHLMAGIQVNLLKGYGFTDTEWENLEKQIIIENTQVNTWVDLATGEISLNGTEIEKEPINAIRNGDVWRAVVAPQIIPEGTVLLTACVDSVKYQHIHPIEPLEYISGKMHKFTIVVNQRLPEGDFEFEVLQEAITAWESDEMSHASVIRQYIDVSVDEPGSLSQIINGLKLLPEDIINLKLSGVVNENDFRYIRESLFNLEALNMKDLKTIDCPIRWGEQSIENAIPTEAFKDLHSLKYVVFPDDLKALGEGCFYGVNLTGNLILPNRLEYIGSNAFCGYGAMHNSLTGKLKIPSQVKYIGDHAFERCDFTGELVLPESMEYLGSGAFQDCKYLTGTIQIPNGLTEVNDAWTGTNLTGTIIIPQGVKIVNGIGGKYCSVYFPEGVEYIHSVFESEIVVDPVYANEGPLLLRTSLKGDIHIPNSLKSLSYGAFYGTQISHVTFPDHLKEIPYGAFAHTQLMDTLVLPKSLTKIVEGAFYNCEQLEAVIIPEGVTDIDAEAFSRCYHLIYVQCLGKKPPVLHKTVTMFGEIAGAFDGVNKEHLTLVVPDGCVEAYRNADGWNEFKRITEYRNFVCRPISAKLLNNANTREMILNADDAWQVKSKPDWCSISAMSGYKKTPLTVSINRLERNQGNRYDSIVFQLTNQPEVTTCYYISQYDYEHEEDGELLLQQADCGKGINICMVGDGYDAEDISNGTYLNDMQQCVEYFFDVEPYKTYRDYFNVSVLFPLSEESGIASINRWRDTKFGITLGKREGRITADDGSIFTYASDHSALMDENNAGQALVIALANAEEYDGVTTMWPNGAATAVCTKSTSAYPHDARGLIQHEAGGHGFGKLGDEYIYHNAFIQTCQCSDGCLHVPGLLSDKAMGWCRNLSLNGRYSNHEWRQLMFHPNYSDYVDLYEGGYFHSHGVYRSEANSCMNNNVPYFSAVSRMAIVERIMEYAGEKFDFEEFVRKDSREMGRDFTRSGNIPAYPYNMDAPARPTVAPVMMKGSPFDLKNK